MTGKNLLNAVLFQVVWFAAVLGAAHKAPWLGPVVLLPALVIHLALAEQLQAELKLMGAAAGIGLLFDSLLVANGLFTPVQYLFPLPISPLWMVCLWINFATTLNRSMSWLQSRRYAAALFGAIGGPMAYYSGASLGAATSPPGLTGILAIAFGWGCVTPLLCSLSVRLKA